MGYIKNLNTTLVIDSSSTWCLGYWIVQIDFETYETGYDKV